MAVKYGDPGYKYFRDHNGRVYALRDYWTVERHSGRVNGGDTLSFRVHNHARDSEWYDFNDFDYYGWGMKYMARKAEEKAAELNARDQCVIPCSVVRGTEQTKNQGLVAGQV